MEKTIDDYKEYKGVDIDLETSLFEYGFIVGKTEECQDDEFHVIFKCYTVNDKMMFDHAYIRMNELVNEPWIEWDDVLEFAGNEAIEDYWQFEPTNIDSAIATLSILLSYYGYENILGTPYLPFNIYSEDYNLLPRYATVVFIQDYENETIDKLLHELRIVSSMDDAEHTAIEYLKQWDNGEYYEYYNISNEQPWGASDTVHKENEYILSYNTMLGYMALTIDLKNDM